MINVIGLGYIGLPTAMMMASHGLKIVGTDYDEKLISELKEGKLPFEEKGLMELYAEAKRKQIEFTTEYQVSDTYIIAVPTPYDKFTKKVDPSYVITALQGVLAVAPDNAIVVIESTMSPGTVDKSLRPIINMYRKAENKNIYLAHAPERIIPGNMIEELLNNKRTIGVDNAEIGEKLRGYYGSFCKGEIIITDIRTAEMTKVVENTYRAVNIAFANELAKICRHDDLDVYEVIRICNMHPRVNILNPGPGVGGHCISVDPWFLVGDYPHLAKVIDEAMKTNDSMPDFVLNRIFEIMEAEHLYDISKVGLYGLTYKENVDDIRESPTLQLLASHKRHLGTGLKVYDPYVTKDIVDNQYHDFDMFVKSCDFIVIMVKHDEIINRMHELSNKVILDCQNVCSYKNAYKL